MFQGYFLAIKKSRRKKSACFTNLSRPLHRQRLRHSLYRFCICPHHSLHFHTHLHSHRHMNCNMIFGTIHQADNNCCRLYFLMYLSFLFLMNRLQSMCCVFYLNNLFRFNKSANFCILHCVVRNICYHFLCVFCNHLPHMYLSHHHKMKYIQLSPIPKQQYLTP